MAAQASRSAFLGWKYWAGLFVACCGYVLVAWIVHETFGGREVSAERRRLCDQAVGWVLTATDPVTLERGKYLIKELDCDIAARAAP
ncbi:hypothetical protein LRS10_22050 [Phenylobacterium sp. J426]|uniref:hypothetical protein n=1 Tax=Phenylobacterium sp. J426 TaxID=2898439 RepID=UPI002151E884|nr:hypothetical protein [Phenylobacterium sp. J426]MCR5876594.1 hypothetical protein [Phenylobacterium sp. J426]